MTPIISVLFPAYRESLSHFSQALDSVLHQSYSNLEILIGFDDPNQDELIDYARSKLDPRVYIFIHQSNIGLVENLNFLAKQATGELIARMDADDICLPNRLEIQASLLLREKVDLVACSVMFVDEHNNHLRPYCTVYRNYSGNMLSPLLTGRPLIHPTWLLRRAVFEKLGGYRSVFLAEDYDLVCRLYSGGFKIGYLHETLLFYRIRSSSLSRQRIWEQLRNFYLVNSRLMLNHAGISWEGGIRFLSLVLASLSLPAHLISTHLSSLGYRRLSTIAKFTLFPPAIIPRILRVLGF